MENSIRNIIELEGQGSMLSPLLLNKYMPIDKFIHYIKIYCIHKMEMLNQSGNISLVDFAFFPEGVQDIVNLATFINTTDEKRKQLMENRNPNIVGVTDEVMTLQDSFTSCRPENFDIIFNNNDKYLSYIKFMENLISR